MTARTPPPPRPIRRITLLKRVRRLQSDGGGTLHFMMQDGRRMRTVAPQDVPEFEGEYAWFEMERIAAKPWPIWRALRQVEAPKDIPVSWWLDRGSPKP